jgi:hypothetical protein
MQAVANPLLKIMPDDERKARELETYIDSLGDRHKEVLDHIRLYKEGHSEPYYSFVDERGTPDTKRLVKLGPLIEDPKTEKAILTMTYSDDRGAVHKLRYFERVCPVCRRPLHEDAGKMDFYIVSVFGIRNIGKTQFISTACRMAKNFDFERFTSSCDLLPEQVRIMDSLGIVSPTADLVLNKDNFYTFKISGGGKSSCVIFLDTPGERLLKAIEDASPLSAESAEKMARVRTLIRDGDRGIALQNAISAASSTETDYRLGQLKELIRSSAPVEQLLDAIEERSSAEAQSRLRELMWVVTKTNMLLFFADPTKTRNYEARLAKAYDDRKKFEALSRDSNVCDPLLLLKVHERKAEGMQFHQEHPFEDTVSLFCKGLKLVDTEGKLNLAIVFTKLDKIEYCYNTAGFYDGDLDLEGSDVLFVKNDPLFTKDRPEDAPKLNRNWAELISRGQFFMYSESKGEYRQLADALNVQQTDIPVFLISNGSMIPSGLTAKEIESSKGILQDVQPHIHDYLEQALDLNPKAPDTATEFKSKRKQLEESLKLFQKAIKFSNAQSKQCLPLFQWIITTLLYS